MPGEPSSRTGRQPDRCASDREIPEDNSSAGAQARRREPPVRGSPGRAAAPREVLRGPRAPAGRRAVYAGDVPIGRPLCASFPRSLYFCMAVYVFVAPDLSAVCGLGKHKERSRLRKQLSLGACALLCPKYSRRRRSPASQGTTAPHTDTGAQWRRYRATSI